MWKIPLYKSFERKDQKIYLIRGDSHNQETLKKVKNILNDKKIDFLFIDGDHFYQGVQYCDKEYVEILKENSIQISMSDKGNPYQNNITESFFKTLKYNEVYLNEYDDFEEAYRNIENFIEVVYQKKRLHSSLGYLPPEEFEEKFLVRQQKPLFSENRSKNQALECSEKVLSEPR